MKRKVLLSIITIFGIYFLTFAQKKTKDPIKSAVSGLKFRSIGPAFSSGRIADFAVNPDNPAIYYVATASGHIWKTVNNGISFKPIFEHYGAYSIGCITMDSNNHNILWAGTGENNHQRALGYGNGVYKTLDGGKSWKNMGLKDSRQIGMININPKNSDEVLVAAEGSVWGAGGDRGLYKTLDAGKTWKKVLDISKETGVNNVVRDPSNPKIMYATSEQRRRHVFTKIGGGPESNVYKSEDGGDTWRKIVKGLPSVDKGGMGIAVSPVNPNVVYLIIEAAEDKGGFYRSTDKGESWTKMSKHSESGQYYNEIYCDSKDVDKVYSVETKNFVTKDGGKTWHQMADPQKHVDNHAMWINPNHTDHFMYGTDGGIYVTYDGGKSYRHVSNLPIVQFYRVYIDNAKPFYNVYGGTQDNNSYGGPSSSISADGVSKADWVVTIGGDGFWGAVDPTNPNIVYSEYQYGNLYRYDKKSKEHIKIKPMPGKDELTYRWNWNAPIIISPHNHKRLYVAANKVFKSDDMGNSWQTISPDLTEQMDRNTWKVMGKFWSADAVKKDVSTSLYGTIVSFDESPVKEGLLYVGTDDGVIQVTEDDGKTWKKYNKFPDVPAYTYVSDVFADRFDENTIYASFDNRKRDDFKAYLLKSTDKGKTWKNISNNLPENGTVHSVSQDFVKSDLLFVGTEFSFYFSVDGGQKWHKFSNGMPDVAVRDIAIQKRENDIVLATFGRGFYILDDYSPLRQIDKNLLDKEAYIFPVKEALSYIQSNRKYGQGATDYYAKNRPFGATFTYYLKEAPVSSINARHKKEKKLFKNSEKIPQPSWKEMENEEQEEIAYLLFSISDAQGNVVKKMTASASKGVHRITWNLKADNPFPVNQDLKKFNPLHKERFGIPVAPGTYKVSMGLFEKGKYKKLTDAVSFKVTALENSTLASEKPEILATYFKELSSTIKKVDAIGNYADDLQQKMVVIKQTALKTPAVKTETLEKIQEISQQVSDLRFKLHGLKARASYEEIPPHKLPLLVRLNEIAWRHMGSTAPVTQTEREQLKIVQSEIPVVSKDLRQIALEKLPLIKKELQKAGSPWIEGQLPE